MQPFNHFSVLFSGHPLQRKSPSPTLIPQPKAKHEDTKLHTSFLQQLKVKSQSPHQGRRQDVAGGGPKISRGETFLNTMLDVCSVADTLWSAHVL